MVDYLLIHVLLLCGRQSVIAPWQLIRFPFCSCH
jgi:hypothetical protein